MVIIYESKTGFTQRYANMLAAKTKLKAIPVKDISRVNKDEQIIFLGWMKVGKIQGLKKLSKHNVKAVCGSGTGRTAEPSTKAVVARNKIENIQFLPARRMFSFERAKGYG